MKARAMIALLGAALSFGCEAIDDFGPFHVVGADGAAPPDAAFSWDGVIVGDMSVDGMIPDYAMPDIAMPDLLKPDLAATCVQSLANVGAGDFSIRFRITTTTIITSAMLYQRPAPCGHGTFWDVYGGPGGIGVETDDGASYTALGVIAKVNDGVPHDVAVIRTKNVIYVFVDGILSGSDSSLSVLGNLPPLGIGSGNPCSNHQTLVGTVENVCLTKM